MKNDDSSSKFRSVSASFGTITSPSKDHSLSPLENSRQSSFSVIFHQIYGFYSVFFVLIIISWLIPDPLIEQSHIRPIWSLSRPNSNIVACQIQELTPFNHKVRLSIRFLNQTGKNQVKISGPFLITMSKRGKVIKEIESSYLPPFANKVEQGDLKSPFQCIFESNLVNYDTLYFRAFLQGKPNSNVNVEIKWSVIRTFFGAYEGSLSFTFGVIIFIVVMFRFVHQSNMPLTYWNAEQKTTLLLSCTVMIFDFAEIVPFFLFPSVYTLALSDISRALLRAYSIFYSIIVFNLMLREHKKLRTVRSLVPLLFSIIYFSITTVFLVSNVEDEYEYYWPVELRTNSSIQTIIILMLIIVMVWIFSLTIYVLINVKPHYRFKTIFFSIVCLPFLIAYFVCDIMINDMKLIRENPVTYAVSIGSINIFCLLIEFLNWPQHSD